MILNDYCTIRIDKFTSFSNMFESFAHLGG
jgi:hypothetical protein